MQHSIASSSGQPSQISFNNNVFGEAPQNPSSMAMAMPSDGSQPINIGYQRKNSIYNPRLRRESIAHSQGMGGISWGSVTIGSWLKDEVMLLNNYHNNNRTLVQPSNNNVALSPSMNANMAYLADLETEYCKDYSCCGQHLPNLHDLLRHYEELHIQPSPPMEAPRARPVNNPMDTVSTNEVFLSHDPNAYLQNNNFGLTSQDHSMMDHHDSMNSGFGFVPKGSDVLNQMQRQQSPLHADAHFAMDEDENNGDEMCIDDPARHLYVMERGEHRPFKCPVIGCDKTYKNQNGLKYHRIHGHQNQKLHDNEDGTFSVIDPESNAPYPDGMALERDKPYRCEVCGKRYKNLNGLKYHRGHTTH